MNSTTQKHSKSDELREIRVNGDLYFLASDVENWHRNHMALSEAAHWTIEFFDGVFLEPGNDKAKPACLVALEAALG